MAPLPRPRPSSTPAQASAVSSIPQPLESPISVARQKVQQNLLRAKTQRSRKKRTSNDSDSAQNNEDDVTYVTYGRKFARIGDLFNRIETIVEVGIQSELAEESLPLVVPEDRHLRESWKILKAIIPNFCEHMIDLHADKKTRNMVFSMINRARDDVRADDTSGLKIHAPSYLLKNKTDLICPPLPKAEKALRGWGHPQCAAALCPVELSASDETYAMIEAGNIIVTADQLPRFLYPDGHVFDPDNIYLNLLHGHYCFRVGKHIFQGPSSSLAEPGWSRGRSGNAALIGITSMTPRSIAYIVVQARFAISSASQWGAWDKNFDYSKFYWNIVDLFEDGEGQDIIEAFNYQIFGMSDPSAPSTSLTPAGPSYFDLLRQQRAAKRARLAMDQSEENEMMEDALM
ncbi:hypothetical protein C0992_003454, partial [Termitomyces sp. T32_za158]